MRNLKYFIVDVFAEAKYQGNQLAVFLDTTGLETSEMQSIALETGFAETTFIESSQKENGGYNVRIFTPDTEVPFAGHPTLGTAYIISKYIEPLAEDIIMNYSVGQVPVSVSKTDNGIDILWMKQINPEFQDTLDIPRVSEILGIPKDYFLDAFPITRVSTGLPFYMVPLKTLAAVKEIAIDVPAYRKLFNEQEDQIITPAFMSFCTETYEQGHHINCRMHYMENNQIVEDAATGSANGCLLSYLLEYNFFNASKLQLTVEQGYEIRRPSIIFHDGEKLLENDFKILIGGRVQEISEGKWFH